MTQPDLFQLFKDKCQLLGQAEVARRLGYSDPAISQAVNGKYNGGDISAILAKVEEVFGSTIVDCPILGEIPLGKCAEKRKLPFAATNPVRVALFRACRNCKQGGGK